MLLSFLDIGGEVDAAIRIRLGDLQGLASAMGLERTQYAHNLPPVVKQGCPLHTRIVD
ncbi:hypothetical protein D3C71_1962860 [compost metagenome]